jgi:hypothetical protein
MKVSPWRLFVNHVFKLLMHKTQTESYYQFYAVQTAYSRRVLFHVIREHNYDYCGCFAELHGLCGR